MHFQASLKVRCFKLTNMKFSMAGILYQVLLMDALLRWIIKNVYLFYDKLKNIFSHQILV